MGSIPLAYAIDLGWLRIGPPYIYINIDPVIVHIGSLALRWYGLMYVVAIIIGLWVIQGYTQSKGISPDKLYRILWWCIAAGLVGGRLYFVVQQPNLVSYYLANPINIIATWEGGMAFFGAIFLIVATLLWRARVERLNPLVLIDAGVIFAAAGQIFGRIGNLINGDIIGYRSTLPWSTVYQNPNSWACLNLATCNVPVQPAAAYEMLIDIAILLLLLYLAKRIRRPGILSLVYMYCYAISQFLIFFVRDNIYVNFLGITALKQAQWTSIIMFIALIPLTYLVLKWHYSQPVPEGEPAATYGIEQKPEPEPELEKVTFDHEEPEQSAEDEQVQETKPVEVEDTHEAESEKAEATGEESEATSGS
jgi:phosphatidylglycerol:prolipoprotein diacylglycerol transferase